VVNIYAVEDDPVPFLVMEYIPGRTLQQVLDERGPMDVPDVLRFGKQILNGLAAAHEQGLIHRDVKPTNIMLESDNDDYVKITDFGLARAADDASITRSGVIAGTPLYMAPEQALGQKFDERADLFSFGSVLYQMLSGRPPFRAPSTPAVLKRVAEDTPRPIQEIIPEVPDWMCAIVTRLHAKNPDDRFASAREVEDLLEHCRAELEHGRVPVVTVPRVATDGTAAPPPSSSTRVLRRRSLAAATVLVLLLVALGITEATGVTEFASTLIRLASGPGTPGIETDNPDDGIASGGGQFTNRSVGVAQPGTTPVKPNAPTAGNDGWMELFNGRDLSGWKTCPEQPGNWTVEDGVLVGRPPLSHLFTERGDYKDFHVYMEARINVEGDTGLYFRSEYGLSIEYGESRVPMGYETQIADGHRLGSLHVHEPDGTGMHALEVSSAPKVPTDTWITLEVIAIEDHLAIRANGEIAVDFHDTSDRYREGHIALQCFGEQTEVRVRKMLIKEVSSQSQEANSFAGAPPPRSTEVLSD
jgi:hypothetical protein